MAVLGVANGFVLGIIGAPAGKLACGMTVLWGADFFVLGIMGVPSGK